MKETNFIKQNKKKWQKFEHILSSEQKDPDKLSELFVQVTDDLSYSRTFYPNRSVRIYLNNLAQQVFYSIYKNKKEKGNHFLTFWKEELPLLLFQARPELLISTIIFVVSMAIGVLSCVNDPTFPNVILGDDYVQMSIENIKKNDPMAVYKKMNQVDMFFGITFNNLFVAFRTFIFGAFFGIGTLGIMIFNGVMVGTFQYFFFERGLFVDSFLTIWMHGTLEISSIIIAGASGLVLGKGLVFPGTYSRMQAFQISANRGLKIMLSIVPILIFAAFIESFITRYTDVPTLLRVAVISISLFFILGYYVYYPWLKSKKGFKFKINEVKLAPKELQKINFLIIKNNGEIFRDVFVFYFTHFVKILSLSFIITLIYIPGVLYLLYSALSYDLSFSEWFFSKLWTFFDYKINPILYFLNTLMMSVNASFILTLLEKDSVSKPDTKLRLPVLFLNLIKSIVVFALINLSFYLGGLILFLMLVAGAPLLLIYLYIMIKEKCWFIYGFRRTFLLMKDCYVRSFGIYFTMLAISIIYFFFIDSPFLIGYFEIIKWNISTDDHTMEMIFIGFISFTSILGFNLVLPLITTGQGILYFTAREINEAVGLKERIRKLSEKKNKTWF